MIAGIAAGALTPEAFFAGLEGITMIVPLTIPGTHEDLVGLGGKLPTEEGPIPVRAFAGTARPSEAVLTWVEAARGATRERSVFIPPGYRDDNSVKIATGQEAGALVAIQANSRPAGRGRRFHPVKEYRLLVRADGDRRELAWSATYHNPGFPWAPPHRFICGFAGPRSMWRFNLQANEARRNLEGRLGGSFSDYTTLEEDYHTLLGIVQVLVDRLRVLRLEGLSVFLNMGTRSLKLPTDDGNVLGPQRVRWSRFSPPVLPEGVDQRGFFEEAKHTAVTVDVRYGDEKVFAGELSPRAKGWRAPTGTLTMTFLNPLATSGLVPKIFVEQAAVSLGGSELFSTLFA